MTFIDITCMSDRSEEVIIETFPRRNDTPFFTTRSCRLVYTNGHGVIIIGIIGSRFATLLYHSLVQLCCKFKACGL